MTEQKRSMSIWIDREILAAADEAVKRERYASRSWLVQEAVFQFLKNLNEIRQFSTELEGGVQ